MVAVTDEAALSGCTTGSSLSKSHRTRFVKCRSQLRHNGLRSSHYTGISVLNGVGLVRAVSMCVLTFTLRILHVRHPSLLFLCALRAMGLACITAHVL